MSESAGGILDEYLEDDECADELGITTITLARWRRIEKKGPPFTKVGRKFLYKKSSVQAWLAAQEQQIEHPKQVDKPDKHRSKLLASPVEVPR